MSPVIGVLNDFQDVARGIAAWEWLDGDFSRYTPTTETQTREATE
jgi:hypothetical protein